MKTIIQWETPCRLLHADGYRCQIERRTFAQFKKIIGATRDWPLLLDVHSEEADDVNRAIDGFRLGRTFHKHLDALRRRAGWARCATWPASYALPDDRTARAAFVYSPTELAEVASSTACDHEFLEPLAKSGRKMRGAQAQRRALWQAQRRDDWRTWQAWIDEAMRLKKWSFEFAQSKAAEHFQCCLKTIQRRTKKPGQAD
jgi:hypothetical protein